MRRPYLPREVSRWKELTERTLAAPIEDEVGEIIEENKKMEVEEKEK